MKNIAIRLAALVLPTFCGGAAVPAELTVSSDISVVSDHVFRGINRAGTSFQPNLELALPADWILGCLGGGDLFGGFWGNLPVGEGANELRYYAGIGLVAPQIDLVSFETGLTVYHFPGTGSDRNHEVFLGAHFGFSERPMLRGSLFYFYDLDFRSHAGEGRLVYYRSLEHLGLPSAIDFSLVGGPQGGGRTAAGSYWFFGGAVELTFFLSDNSTATFGVGYETTKGANLAQERRNGGLFWRAGVGTFF